MASMTRILKRDERHFIDQEGRIFWINGPESNCYLAEQMVWREGLHFAEVLLWKQCAPSGRVSQRFDSIAHLLEAFEAGQVRWSLDHYLRRLGIQMREHRSVDDYKPTAMKEAEAHGATPRMQPWLKERVAPMTLIGAAGTAEQVLQADQLAAPRSVPASPLPSGDGASEEREDVVHRMRRRRRSAHAG